MTAKKSKPPDSLPSKKRESGVSTSIFYQGNSILSQSAQFSSYAFLWFYASLLVDERLPLELDKPGLYVCKDGDKIVYIGIATRSVRKRLHEHYPKPISPYEDNYHNLTRFGKAIRDNLPQAREWIIEVFFFSEMLHEIEKILISAYQPKVNCHHNRRQT